MKEQLMGKPKAEVKWPFKESGESTQIIEVGSSVDFIYIARKDGEASISPVAQRISQEYGLGTEDTRNILLSRYDVFFARVIDIFGKAVSEKGHTEIHLYDPNLLDRAIRKKSKGKQLVSMDPLLNGDANYEVSRVFAQGGQEKSFAYIARPGSEPLSIQAKQIADKVGKSSAVLTDDDLYTGGSMLEVLETLLNQGVKIDKVVPGVQVGEPEKLLNLGINVEPVIKYKASDESDIFAKVDIIDPRDYLLGLSGFVVQLPGGSAGRASAVLPFFSPANAVSVPPGREIQFSLSVLIANLAFFREVEEQIGYPLLLSHMDPSCRDFMQRIYNISPKTTMADLVNWSIGKLRNSDMHK